MKEDQRRGPKETFVRFLQLWPRIAEIGDRDPLSPKSKTSMRKYEKACSFFCPSFIFTVPLLLFVTLRLLLLVGDLRTEVKGERRGRRTSGSIENFSIGQSATQSSSTLLSLPSSPPSSSGQSCCSQSKELWERGGGGGGRAFLSLDPCFPFPLLRCPFILQKKVS